MNEQFALELHRAGDAIATLQSLATGPVTLFFRKAPDDECLSVFVSIMMRDADAPTAVILAQFAPSECCPGPILRAAPVDLNLGAVMAKTYRELFGVFEDTETDSE